ncbi:hypothetical protein DV735_g1162, partial [Chaetothyriales sp. CBS 134920]
MPTAQGNLSQSVSKPTPYEYSLAHLAAADPNPLPPAHDLTRLPRQELNRLLQATARDGTQSLIATLLTTTAIQSTPEGLPKAPTTWERFAKKKGIGRYGGAQLEERRKKLVYDEEKGDWVPRWGYKGRNMESGREWLVEVDDKKKAVEDAGRNIRGEGHRERAERVRRQQRRERKNSARSRTGVK